LPLLSSSSHLLSLFYRF